MITNLDITGVRYTPDELTKKYVTRKLGRLDRYVNRHARKTMTLDVKLKQVNRAHGNKYECEVIINLPELRITAQDSTMNMLAAVDIVEQKLKTQLKKYHDEHTNHRGRHDFLGRFKRRIRRPATEV